MMTEDQFDALLRKALLETNRQEWQEVSDDGEFEPTERYRARREQLLADPFRHTKKHSHPMWRRVLQTAACALLVISLAFGGLMAASPAARAWVRQMTAEWFGSHARFTFAGGAGQESGEWETTWLPEGFTLFDEKQIGMMAKITYQYQNGAEQEIQLVYAPADGTAFMVDSEHQTCEDVTVNGVQAQLLRATAHGETSFLIWTDATSATAFQLSATGDADDLIQIAQGIQKVIA